MPKLTKRVIDGLSPREGRAETFTWDSELNGFGVRMMPSGTGSYILKYRTEEGRQRKLALGRVGALTPDEARALARDRLAQIAKGKDPSAERRAIRSAITVCELCNLYIADAAPRIRQSTLAMDRSRIDCHVRPLIGSRSVVSLTADDLERLQKDIAAGKSARPRIGRRGGESRGGRGVASRTIGMLGTILQFARRKQIIHVNSAGEVVRFSLGKQERYLSESELRFLGAAMGELEREFGNHVGFVAIRFLLLSGIRRMEALTLQVDSVDEENNCLRLVENKRARGIAGGSRIEIRPVGDAALLTLRDIPRSEECKWIFPGYIDGQHYVGLPGFLAKVCARVGLENVTIHVLRHSFAAMAKGLGYSEFVIAGLLGHRIGGITDR